MNLILLQNQLKAFDSEYNLAACRETLERNKACLASGDIILLPEHTVFVSSGEEYRRLIAPIAKDFNCHVAGGSFHKMLTNGAVNTGSIFAPDGTELGVYEKLRPYSEERKRVQPGTVIGEFSIEGMRVLVLICADFWFSDLYHLAEHAPDLILVPALSVTRKESPDYSRTLWRHLAIARAYEFGAYIGISDWAHPSELPRLFTSGVGGFADPTTIDAERFFTGIPDSGFLSIPLDLNRLHDFRNDRKERGFFWK